MFPIITHINDVLPAIAGRDEFVVGKRDGYQFIDYNYTQSDSFDCPIRRECRGLKFDLEGNLIARPFHKFFNFHEKPSEVELYAHGPKVVMKKLDGSMVHPARIPLGEIDGIDHGEIRWMTRAGITEQALMAEKFAGKDINIVKFVVHNVYLNCTPIFEYTAPHNQIVVRYDEEKLTLLAVRKNDTGEYVGYETMKRMADHYGIPAVDSLTFHHPDDFFLDAVLSQAKGLKDEEGYVIQYANGFTLKMKADDYVLRHRARSNLLWEKDVLAMVLDRKTDDVIGMLPPDEAERLKAWDSKVMEALNKAASACVEFWRVHNFSAPMSRKDYAAKVTQMNLTYLGSVLFAVYDGKPALDAMIQVAKKQTSSAAKARAFLDKMGIEPWTPTKVELDG